MTHKNIFAYTATQHPYPGYISINDDEDGSYRITVRSPSNGGRDIGQVIVSSELLASMATAIQQHQLNASSASIQSPSAQADQRIEAELVAAGLTFGLAIESLKLGKRVARAGWNGKGMFVYRVPANSYPTQTGAAKAHFGDGAMVPYNAYLAIKNVDETVSTWVPSVNDCLAEDWCIVEGAA